MSETPKPADDAQPDGSQTPRVADLEAQVTSLSKAARDHHLLKATNEALTRRLEDSQQSAQSRESLLGAIVLDDGAELARLRAENARLQAELSVMQNSRSWKITKPLRRTRTQS